jgi:hypothetical protein
MLQKHVELRGFLDMIITAKEKGMIDHREAKDLWLRALAEAGMSVTPSAGRHQG